MTGIGSGEGIQGLLHATVELSDVLQYSALVAARGDSLSGSQSRQSFRKPSEVSLYAIAQISRTTMRASSNVTLQGHAIMPWLEKLEGCRTEMPRRQTLQEDL